MFEEDFPGLTPINFFSIECDCYYAKQDSKKELGKKYRFPVLSSLTHEKPFAELAMGWSEDGIVVEVAVDKPYEQSFFPNVQQGDSVELFIDTRDVKTSGYNTRFCHHFFFLPQSFEGQQAGEMTHFRTEDTHELCDGSQLSVQATLKKNSYELKIFIPSHCLYGYDPDQFDRIGFSYRINRYKGSSQHFSASTREYQIEQQPSLWSSVRLVRENSSV